MASQFILLFLSEYRRCLMLISKWKAEPYWKVQEMYGPTFGGGFLNDAIICREIFGGKLFGVFHNSVDAERVWNNIAVEIPGDTRVQIEQNSFEISRDFSSIIWNSDHSLVWIEFKLVLDDNHFGIS
ncbi:MAG TPA: hypothetical protein VJ399_01235 [Patescibacteria group bacterium]|nr:hypothetical protein [Patescibacteria group bacterium]